MNTVIFSNYDDCFKSSALLLEDGGVVVVEGDDFEGSPYFVFNEYDGFKLFDYFMNLFGGARITRIILIENAEVVKIRLIKFKKDGLIQVVDEKENIIEE